MSYPQMHADKRRWKGNGELSVVGSDGECEKEIVL